MTLDDYIQGHPRPKRRNIIEKLACLHGCSVSTVYSWQKKGFHPPFNASMDITEAFTNQKVTRFDLRPDVFDYDTVRAMAMANRVRSSR